MDVGNPRQYIKTNQLRYFVAVADAGSIAKGAKILNISQPPLTTRIKELEAAVGAQLFERNARGVVLTESGQSFLAEARLALSQNNRAFRAASGQNERRHLRIGMLSWIMWGAMPGAMGRYMALNPYSKLTVKDFGSSQQIEMLCKGELDLGVNRFFQIPNCGSLNSLILRRDRLCAVVSENGDLAKCQSVSLKQLVGMDLITMEESVSDFNKHLVGMHQSYGICPKVGQTTNEIQTALALVANGFGYSIFPETLGTIPWPGIKFIRISETLPDLLLAALWPKSNISPETSKFVNFLHRSFLHPKGKDDLVLK